MDHRFRDVWNLPVAFVQLIFTDCNPRGTQLHDAVASSQYIVFTQDRTTANVAEFSSRAKCPFEGHLVREFVALGVNAVGDTRWQVIGDGRADCAIINIYYFVWTCSIVEIFPFSLNYRILVDGSFWRKCLRLMKIVIFLPWSTRAASRAHLVNIVVWLSRYNLGNGCEITIYIWCCILIFSR